MPIIRDILYGAASNGASLKKLCEALEIPVEELTNSEKTVPFEKAYRAWELALKQTGDQLLGLHLGETATPSILGLIGHLMQSSPDLLTAYQQLCKLAELVTDMFIYSIDIRGEYAILTYRPATSWIKVSRNSARQAVEQAMAGTLNVFYLLSGKKIKPVQAGFSFDRAGFISEYERVFGSVSFGKKQNALSFKITDLKAPITSYDQSLFAMFDRIIQQKLHNLRRNILVADRVRKILTEDFNGRIVPAELVATRMNMSVRTFQRKLNEEGISYRKLSTALRKDIATKLLKQSGARVQEIAHMLGYSEASALRKVLK